MSRCILEIFHRQEGEGQVHGKGRYFQYYTGKTNAQQVYICGYDQWVRISYLENQSAIVNEAQRALERNIFDALAADIMTKLDQKSGFQLRRVDQQVKGRAEPGSVAVSVIKPWIGWLSL